MNKAYFFILIVVTSCQSLTQPEGVWEGSSGFLYDKYIEQTPSRFIFNFKTDSIIIATLGTPESNYRDTVSIDKFKAFYTDSAFAIIAPDTFYFNYSFYSSDSLIYEQDDATKAILRKVRQH